MTVTSSDSTTTGTGSDPSPVATDPDPDETGAPAATDPATADPASVLLPADTTAARERERLLQAAGRSGVAAMVAGLVPGIRRLGSAEAAANGLRYRPVAWTIIAVVAVAFYLPGRAERVVAPEIAAAPSAVTPVPASPSPEPADTAVDTVPVAPTPSFTPSPAAPFEPSPSAPSDPPPTAPPASGPVGDQPAPAQPLTVRGAGWATRVPATPVPGDSVPEGTFPVANRLGSVDRVSFIRLAGDATTLVLTEDAEASREALGPGAVAACPIEDDGWAEEPGQSFDDAPTWSEDTCVAGTETDGQWTFDLSSFADRTGDAGFALVPTTDAPPDFQVGFTG